METEEKKLERFEDEVRVAAYYIWLRRIRRGWSGDPESDWFRGKEQICHQHHIHFQHHHWPTTLSGDVC